MTEEQVRKSIQDITVWKRNGERAPHKPLVLLYALARASRQEPRLVAYAKSYSLIKEILHRFGPDRKTLHPEYPFQRLCNDGIWQIEFSRRPISTKLDRTDLSHRQLIDSEAAGGFSDDVYTLLIKRQDLTQRLASEILEANFPESLHDDILDAVGMSSRTEVIVRRVRNREFRLRVLRTYQHRCAVCGFDVQLSNRHIAVEAAHIRWHQVFHASSTE